MAYPEHPGVSEAPVLCWRDEAVAHIRFNRPAALNAIDVSLAQAFAQACETVAADPLVRCVVLSGEGRAFMAGGDLQAMRADPVGSTATIIEYMHAAIAVLGRLTAPVIAVLHGAVAGGGLGVALTADLALAAQGTRFNLAYTRIGTNTDCGASWGLVRLLGERKAMEVALLCDPFDADEALRLGLVNWVVPAEELSARATALAQRLAQGPTLALGNLKRLVRQSGLRTLPEQLQAEAEGFAQCARSHDFVEGVGAFLDKRTAQFTGA